MAFYACEVFSQQTEALPRVTFLLSAFVCLIGIVLVVGMSSISMAYAATILCTTVACFVGLQCARKPILIYAFQLGLIIFVFPDGFLAGEALLDMPSGSAEWIAAQYICLSILVFSFCYWMLLKVAKPRSQVNSFSVSSAALPSLIILEICYLVFAFKYTYQSFLFGRSAGVDDGGLNVAMRGVLNVLAMILPALFVFVLKHRQSSRRPYFLRSLIFSLPIFLYIFLQGNRFPLLFSLSMFLLVSFPGLLDLSWRSLLRVLVIVFFGLIVSASMIGVRDRIYDLQDNRMAFGVIKSEGLLESNALLVSYFDYSDHTFGASLGNILLFWVPRSIWESKPTYLGHWLIRSVNGVEVSSQHSAGFGFGGEAYADFGFLGGLIVCGLFGVAFSRMERFVSMFRKTYGLPFLYCTLLVPFSFFFARNVDTAFFMLFSMAILMVIFGRVFVRSNGVG